MSCEYRFRAPRALLASPLLCLAGALLISGCTDLKKAIGLERTSPDEFAVESRAPLTMPPDFDLRPPQPGAARPQEKSSDQAGPPSHRTGGTRRAGQTGARFPPATRRGWASRRGCPQRSGARPERGGRRAEPVEQASGLPAEHRSPARAGRESRDHPAEGGLLTPVQPGPRGFDADPHRARPRTLMSSGARLREEL